MLDRRQIITKVVDYKEWLVDEDDDFTAQHLQITPVNIPDISHYVSEKLLRYKYLGQLTLDGCNICSLEGMPILPYLLRLDLNSNRQKDKQLRIQGRQLVHLTRFDILMVLSLCNNLIALVEELEPLNENPCLYQLELKGNPIRGIIHYRRKVFYILKNITVLDRRNIQERRINTNRLKKSRQEDIDDIENDKRLTTINELDQLQDEPETESESMHSRPIFWINRKQV